MNFSGNTLTLAATDSFRLSEKSISITQKSGGIKDQRVIIPARTLQELLRILNNVKTPSDIETTNQLEIYFSENQIVFILGNIEFTSRLIEGQYPDYKQIIPSKFNTTFEVPIDELLQAVKSVSLFARSCVYDITFELSSEPPELIISSGSSMVGENKCKILSKITGKNNKIVLNYRYMLDGLQSIESGDVILQIIDESSPCVIQPKNSNGHLYIIMPIKQ